MKRNRLIGMLLAGAACLAAGCASGGNRIISQIDGEMIRSKGDSLLYAPPVGPVGYIIGYGDLLDVVFLYNAEYSRFNIRVLPDGTISFPLAGTIQAAGMSVSQLDSLLTERYSEILVDPDIAVIIKEFQNQNVYVLGEVELPGSYRWERGLTLIGVLSLSRGYTEDARKSNVVVIRRIAENHVIGVEVDIRAILDGSNFALDIPVRPFDIVYVPKSRIASTEDFIESMYTIIGRPLDIYLSGWQAVHQKTLYDFYARMGSTQ